ncbi:type II CRISPR RNA-guided endonuclease Cas9 [Ramlibacter sp.]|uniref:type II CRISPR RNA-guided endonuclease Cas9 n=1 Tax=Ramlibacter sp. TaxID=1917967 RepID=UPI002FC7094B
MFDKAGERQLTLGLDIGIASVGWSVLAPDRIVSLGVRVFDKAETADKGESLNLARRNARLLRRRLWRRSWRLKKLARLLKRNGLIEQADFFDQQPGFKDSVWRLRVDGLERLLAPTEWARVLYHLCKHRGFHWVSKAEERKADEQDSGEAGRVKAGLARSKSLMEQKGYRTAAEMVLAEFPDAQRNKQGDYGKALSRSLLADELATLFAAQRTLGNPFASANLEKAIGGQGEQPGGLFWEQRPLRSVLSMLGRCTFEPTEFRAPKASFTAERHVWLTRLNNLRVNVDGLVRPLNEAERTCALLLPYKAGEKFTYKHLRTALVKGGLLPEGFRFERLPYPSRRQAEEEKARDPEDQVLVRLQGWHSLRLRLKKAGLEPAWQQMSVSAIDGRPELLDSIAEILSIYKDDQEIRTRLCELGLPGDELIVDTLLTIRFDGFHALSLKALRRIVPFMERGLRYDEAISRIPEYGHHSDLRAMRAVAQKYLPPFYDGRTENKGMKLRPELDLPRNPVVLRSLNQARKVVNALIRVYGSPAAVHIEMARDLSRPLDERRDIEKLQKEYRDRNDKARDHFSELFGRRPSGVEFEKYLLYREQEGKCAYSLNELDLDRVVNDLSYAQVDHVLPYSRSYDDSRNNKVLVLTAVNQDKGNRTPFEYLGGNEESERWRQFAGWVNGNKNYRQAKRGRLLRKNFGKEDAAGFRDRHLNDTRHICRFFKNYLEQHLQLAEDSESRRCVVVNGQLTAFLRARWGLLKIRAESDRHHALDATVVAACSHGMVQRLADYSRRKELGFLRAGFPDPETGEILDRRADAEGSLRFPEPWPHFRKELELRVKCDDSAEMREQLGRFGTYPATALASVKPLFVSRAPQRRNGGAAHKETIYSQPPALRKNGSVAQKVPLTSLTIKDLERLADPHRNARLYEAIRVRLEAYGGKADKAFTTDNPLRKPDKTGQPTGPIVRSVQLVTEKMSGIPVRGGIAKNDSMLRVDVFRRAGRFHLVPVYVHHRVKGLPQRAIVAYKDESDWTSIDDSFEFLFSLHPNDLVRITQKGKAPILGYYASCHRGTGALNLWAHDRNQNFGKDGAISGIGVKVAQSLEKFHVDVLGNMFPAPPEKRRGLA